MKFSGIRVEWVSVPTKGSGLLLARGGQLGFGRVSGMCSCFSMASREWLRSLGPHLGKWEDRGK